MICLHIYRSMHAFTDLYTHVHFADHITHLETLWTRLQMWLRTHRFWTDICTLYLCMCVCVCVWSPPVRRGWSAPSCCRSRGWAAGGCTGRAGSPCGSTPRWTRPPAPMSPSPGTAPARSPTPSWHSPAQPHTHTHTHTHTLRYAQQHRWAVHLLGRFQFCPSFEKKLNCSISK